MESDPFDFERLKYFEQEVYSRRVNHKDRLVYTTEVSQLLSS
ncbi:hypothetical protein BMR02_06340 [Methylococcaceae bacterium HT1]|nr:hypothetical protein BMR10_15805 [Methylococcaceae bacterium CS4]TXK97794.1 hypothetical protein BMR11_09650 [Methylococcaceae bacterium CS5]TXL00130.1 hypothetical protein BMR02_06340 [Methylococcaceae bacterium HT1]TXL03726.1 hypothetical protein BMR08_16985 [Methylococcaceae bacterium CS2]TXL08178.1 hypothetical protein BMR09_03715 [Methylococcaceae bacterium CS3]TXL12536.1 hypothetical protein BMR05_15095 [Methylococcaceae bacterium HT4]TXL12831.1 hypothetical protein BMR04_14940 [Meth